MAFSPRSELSELAAYYREDALPANNTRMLAHIYAGRPVLWEGARCKQTGS